MKKYFLTILLILCLALPVFAVVQPQINWFGNIGLGTSKDNGGFIVFVDQHGKWIFLYINTDYSTLAKGDLSHAVMIAHSYAFYSAHSPNTDTGYFDLGTNGIQLLRDYQQNPK